MTEWDALSRRRLLALGGAAAGIAALGAASQSPARSGVELSPGAAAPKDIAMLVYPGMTALDLVGPFHFLAFLPDSKIHLVTNQPDLHPLSGDPGPAIQPTITMADCPKDLLVLFTPGGAGGTLKAARDPATIDFIRDRASRARFVTSVCTGSLILGVAGLLHGKRATSHWSVVDSLAQFGATPVRRRVVEDGNLITAAGVSAGLDFGLALLDRLSGRKNAETALLITEYAPEPPFSGGSVETARPEIRKAAADALGGLIEGAKSLRALAPVSA
jgi:putative intracellular protease/amidase